MREPSACPDCLRRAQLLRLLAPYIERSSEARRLPRLLERLALGSEELAAAVAPKVSEQLLARVAELPESRLRDDLAQAEAWALCRHEGRYPDALRDGAAAPWVLFGRGDPVHFGRLLPASSVAVVGARRATTYGREVARALGRDLAEAGVAVLSGLAFGIDACAHRGALESGLTVAVLGSGIDACYPAAHRSLWRRVQEGGLVISELPPGCGVWRWTFPARNRIVAALAGMTVVVEAAERSGSLITAGLAADLGRELGAVPGPVGSRASVGTNNLLAAGAHVIRDARDVLDVLHGAPACPSRGIEGESRPCETDRDEDARR